MADPRGDALDVDRVVALRLRQVGQRFTPRRRSLLEILRLAVHPLTINEILDRGRGLAMSSAYRNLTVLEHAGVVKRVITQEDFGRYELAEELTEHHCHLVCTSCGVVRDLGSGLRFPSHDPRREASERWCEASIRGVRRRSVARDVDR